jgi:hypothetical protein
VVSDATENILKMAALSRVLSHKMNDISEALTASTITSTHHAQDPGNCHLRTCRRENLKSHKTFCCERIRETTKSWAKGTEIQEDQMIRIYLITI